MRYLKLETNKHTISTVKHLFSITLHRDFYIISIWHFISSKSFSGLLPKYFLLKYLHFFCKWKLIWDFWMAHDNVFQGKVVFNNILTWVALCYNNSKCIWSVRSISWWVYQNCANPYTYHFSQGKGARNSIYHWKEIKVTNTSLVVLGLCPKS